MKAVKIKFKHAFAEGFEDMMNKLLSPQEGIIMDDDDKLLCAALAEIKERIAVKALKPQEDYSLKLTPVQAIAMRILYNDYVDETTSYMGNALMKIANEVHQKFVA